MDANALRDKIKNGHPSLKAVYSKLLASVEGSKEELPSVSELESVITAVVIEELVHAGPLESEEPIIEVELEPLPCDKCAKSYKTPAALKAHNTREHKEDAETN
jgi:hypothetical protein